MSSKSASEERSHPLGGWRRWSCPPDAGPGVPSRCRCTATRLCLPSLRPAAVEAQQARAQASIRELPDGYETLVGPRGARPSGGQRQRLAIARALLKNAPIVVLDEPTSALDPATEQALSANLRTRLADRSVLLVAHRLSTVRAADRIAVLESGRIIKVGPHAELVRRDGAYQPLYAAQLGQPEYEYESEKSHGDDSPEVHPQPAR